MSNLMESKSRKIKQSLQHFRSHKQNPLNLYQQYKYNNAREAANNQIHNHNYNQILNIYQPKHETNLYLLYSEQLARERQGRHQARNIYEKEFSNGEVRKFDSYDFSDDDQVYHFPEPFIKYKIIPAHKESMALDLQTTAKEDQGICGKLLIWEYHGGSNQHFYIKQRATSLMKGKKLIECEIISASNGFRLDIQNSQPCMSPIVDGSPKQTQIWGLLQHGEEEDAFVIHSKVGGVLDVNQGWMNNGNQVIHYPYKNDDGFNNQKWRVRPS